MLESRYKGTAKNRYFKKNPPRMTLAIRQSLAGGMIGKLEKIGGVTLEMK